MNFGAWMVAWTEHERGIGRRPDGYWYYPTEELAAKHTDVLLKDMRAAEKKIHGDSVPDIYSAPEPPQFVIVSRVLAEQIDKEGKVYTNKRGG